jgi:hypothetical protein
MRNIIGHQANLQCSRQEGKPWKLYVDPDNSWHENTGGYVIEDMDREYVMLRDQQTGKSTFLARGELVIVGYSQKRTS